MKQIQVTLMTPPNVRKAIGMVTFPTKRETAEHFPVHFRVHGLNGVEGYFVYKGDVPAHIREAIEKRF